MKGEKMCKIVQEVGSQKRKVQIQMWTEYEPWCAQIEDLRNYSDEKPPISGLTSGFSIMVVPLRMMR
jgi:hypothetical protein